MLLLNDGVDLVKLPALPCGFIHAHLRGAAFLVEQCPHAVFPHRQMNQMVFDRPACRVGELGQLFVIQRRNIGIQFVPTRLRFNQQFCFVHYYLPAAIAAIQGR